MTYPRVTTILRECLPLDYRWLEPRHLRRGRLVEHAVTLVAQGKQIEQDWWERSSGEGPDDEVKHQDCAPAIEGGRKFLAETGWQLLWSQIEVNNERLSYIGHIDWIGTFTSAPTGHWIIDVKHGTPPSYRSVMDYYERYQLALYALAWNAPIRRGDLHLYDNTYRLVERDNRVDFQEAKLLVQYYHLSQKWREQT